MTREQVKAMLGEGAEDALVTKLLDALHGEIAPHKEAAKRVADEAAALRAQLAEARERAVGSDEHERARVALQARHEAELRAANERLAGVKFEGLLDGLLRDRNVRNIRAAKALLDMPALRANAKPDEAAKRAVEALAGDRETAFLFGPAPTGARLDIGAPVGTPPEYDDMAAIRRAAGLTT